MSVFPVGRLDFDFGKSLRTNAVRRGNRGKTIAPAVDRFYFRPPPSPSAKNATNSINAVRVNRSNIREYRPSQGRPSPETLREHFTVSKRSRTVTTDARQ